MSYRLVTLLALLITFSTATLGEDFKNQLSVQTGYSYILSRAVSERTEGIFNIPGASYQRELRNHVGVKLTFSAWNPSFINGFKSDQTFFKMLDTNQIVGSKLRLKGYKYVDFSAYYHYQFKTHHAYVVLGPSFTFGTTQYITSYYLNPDPPVDMVIYTEDKKEVLLGIVGGLSYNVSFFKNRLSAGPFANFRYYPKLFPQLDFGIQVGYRF